MQQPLDNQVILITGAANRVGAHVVRHLHGLGANILLHYRSSQSAAEQLRDTLLAKRPDSVELLQTDLNDISVFPAMIETAISAWGHLDVLINNASSFYPTPVGTTTNAHWDDLIGSNLKAPFFFAQAATPSLRQRNGCIINIADIHADRPLKNHPVYCVAKAGLVMLTKAMAQELGPEIRVNAIAPGAILWPEPPLDDETKQQIIARSFLKRQGDPENIARAIAFLIKDANYTTGTVLTIDGGRSLNS